MTPRRVALARMIKEAGLRSPRTQLTKVKIEISVKGRRTEASRGTQSTCSKDTENATQSFHGKLNFPKIACRRHHSPILRKT